MEPDNLTIFASSISQEKSKSRFASDGSGSHFSQTFFDKLDANLGFNQAYLESKQTISNYQHPTKYGSNIPEQLDKPMTGSNNGVAIIIEGKYKYESDATSFSKDVDRAKSTYERLGFTVIPVQTFKEYQEAFKKAEAIGKQNPNDTLIVHYSGHGGIIKSKEAPESNIINRTTNSKGRVVEEEELTPAGVPKNNPNDTSVLFFNRENVDKNNYGIEPDKAHLVHEADLTRPIFNTTRQGNFNHVLSVWDACGAGAIDDKQYRNSKETDVQVDPKKVNDFGS